MNNPTFSEKFLQTCYNITSVPIASTALSADYPHWDVETGSIYFVDWSGELFFRYSLNSNQTVSLKIDNIKQPVFFIPIDGQQNRYLIGSNNQASIAYWDGESDVGHVESHVFSVPENKFLDNIYPTEAGELFVSTADASFCEGDNSAANSSIYRYTPANGLVEIANHIKSTAGFAIFNDKLYYLDRCMLILTSFDLDPVTRALSKFTIFFVPVIYSFDLIWWMTHV